MPIEGIVVICEKVSFSIRRLFIDGGSALRTVDNVNVLSVPAGATWSNMIVFKVYTHG
jgi:hypothetical protein